MLNVLRRGSASTATSLCSAPRGSQCIRAIRLQGNQALRRSSDSLYPHAARSLATSPQWRRFDTSTSSRRSATTAAAYQENAIEGEMGQEVYAEEPPSNDQINQATRHGPVTKFKDLAEQGLVSRTVVDTLTKDMGLETMTQVQSLTLNESLKGTDILAQARTGTGKTLAFLIPILQNIINVDPSLENRAARRSGSASDIRAIIISPTRELAEQIAVEAKKVTRNTGVIVQTAVGGSQKFVGLRKIKDEGCHILVGTPGRLNDILSDQYSQVRAPNLSAFVLDEADRLLDQGFAPDIKAIQDLLPDRREMDRQTLLYSATVPREVMQVVRRTMKPDFKFVRTVQEGELQTHERVTQKMVTVGGFENLMPALVELCKRGLSGEGGTTDSSIRPFKAIVYFNATADVVLASSVLQNLKTPGQSVFHQHPLHPAKIIEMHARLSQQQRTRAAEIFRRAESGIMLSSDVTARGMDFPNVTHVIQVGIPPSEEQYVHRIGRTARGDKTGEGWILLTDFETREVRHKLHKMPLQRDNSLETAKVDMRRDAQLPERTAEILTQVQEATKMAPRGMKVSSYVAALGVYSWIPNKQILLDAMNDRTKYGWGMEEPPKVAPMLANKLGLSRLRGINVGHEERDEERSSGSRDRSGRGGRDFDRGRGRSSSFGGDRNSTGRSFDKPRLGPGRPGDRADRGINGKSWFGGGNPPGYERAREREREAGYVRRNDRGDRESYGGGERRNDRGDRDSYGGGEGFSRRGGGRESRYSS